MTEDVWEGFESPHEHKVPAEALEQPTTKDEALKMAIEAIGILKPDNWVDKVLQGKAYSACKEALEQPKQWQGLSDDDISYTWAGFAPDAIDFARAIEAKLKEKNS